MAYNYPSTGEFFVIDEYRESLRRQSAREYEMQYKKQRQMEIAQLLTQKDEEEYGEDILNVLFEQEVKCLPCVASIDTQTEIQWFMRPYLLDFLIEAQFAFGLLPETLFLAINILDRYCSKRVVYRKHYQLVGCTALLIASKYGECSKKVPHVKELANMCCNLYDEDMFIQMEQHVMITLDWHVGSPTVEGFIRMALGDVSSDPQAEHMALYIAEIALFHREFVSTRPSEIAKASLALTRIILGGLQPLLAPWAENYDSHTLVALSQHLHRPSQILVQKYKTSNLSRVSSLLDEFLTRQAAIARCAAGPPTPPVDAKMTTSQLPQVQTTSCETPQKQPNHVTINGVMTPPITPDSDSFVMYKEAAQSRYPETPTPGMESLHVHQQHPPPAFAYHMA